MADSHQPHARHASNPDMRAAFLGLIIGMIALLLLSSTVVMLTNRHYAGEKPAAGASH